MYPYPPYKDLLLVAEQCPECLATLLGLYERKQATNSNLLMFDCELTEGVHEVGWVGFLESLNQLEMWDLIAYEFTSRDTLEVTLPDPEIDAAGKTLS